jgi:NTE family protein
VQVEEFTGAPEVLAVVREVQAREAHYSDIIDDDGHQYVDLVLEGGGMLGLALSGYAHVLEQAGLRFAGIGGTSAGSVTALLLAASGPPVAARAETIIKLLTTTDTRAWVDGPADARALVSAFAEGAGAARMVWRVSQILDEFVDLGLNPGEAVYRWLSTELTRMGIISSGDLQRRMTTCPPGLRTRDGEPLADTAADLFRLAVIAVDLSTETRLELPRMAGLLWTHPDEIDPAWFVRASMSVPLFYAPVRIHKVPQGEAARHLWEELTGYTGQVPRDLRARRRRPHLQLPDRRVSPPANRTAAPHLRRQAGPPSAAPTRRSPPSTSCSPPASGPPPTPATTTSSSTTQRSNSWSPSSTLRASTGSTST